MTIELPNIQITEEYLPKPSSLVRLLQPKPIERRPLHIVKRFDIYLEDFSFGVLADIHGDHITAQAIIDKHPEIKQWYCLGDVVDYTDRLKQNEMCLRWWDESKIPTILGNHDRDFAYACRSNSYYNEKLKTLPLSLKITLPNGYHILMYHSMPKDLVTFVNPGFTEREFIDTYLEVNEMTLAVMIGHNHKQFRSYFIQSNCELWSVGAVVYNGHYALVNDKGMQFYALKS